MATRSPSSRVTLAQVAARAKVSVMTASYAYNRPGRVSDDARGRVREAAAALGYPGPNPSARSLRRGSTRTLGVVLGEHLSYAFTDPQAATFLAGVAEICAERAFGMTILPISGSPDDAARVQAAAVDAFVVWTTTDDDPVIDAVLASRRRAVVHGGPVRDGLHVVSIDNRAAARAVGRAVFERSSRPAILGFPLDRARVTTVLSGVDPATVPFPVTRERLLGFRDAADDVALDWRAVPISICAVNDRRSGQAGAARLLGRDAAPDAVVAMSDELAAGALDAAAAAGLAVPEALAVSGWDDGEVARRHDLTTVRQSLHGQGSSCARIALGEAPLTVTAEWQLVVRGTTRR